MKSERAVNNCYVLLDSVTANKAMKQLVMKELSALKKVCDIESCQDFLDMFNQYHS